MHIKCHVRYSTPSSSIFFPVHYIKASQSTDSRQRRFKASQVAVQWVLFPFSFDFHSFRFHSMRFDSIWFTWDWGLCKLRSQPLVPAPFCPFAAWMCSGNANEADWLSAKLWEIRSLRLRNDKRNPLWSLQHVLVCYKKKSCVLYLQLKEQKLLFG